MNQKHRGERGCKERTNRGTSSGRGGHIGYPDATKLEHEDPITPHLCMSAGHCTVHIPLGGTKKSFAMIPIKVYAMELPLEK